MEVDPSDIVPHPNKPNITQPRTWGVWYLQDKAKGIPFAMGNYPIRGIELARQYKTVKLLHLFTTEQEAKHKRSELARVNSSAISGKPSKSPLKVNGNTPITYGIHPSDELVSIFKSKPFQGAEPDQARILVLGNDANYSPEISDHPFFQQVVEYHEDGVKFWKRYGVHHPFLLRDYPFDQRSGGVRYHRNFQKLGFNKSCADDVSFIELLNVPTIGNTGSDLNQFLNLLNADHLRWIEHLIFYRKPKFVLMNQTLNKLVKRISLEFNVFTGLARLVDGKAAPSVAIKTPDLIIFNGYSFSHSVSNDYLIKLGKIMRQFMDVKSEHQD